MNSLLSTIVIWLSINFGLPAIYDHPQIEIASVGQLYKLRYGTAVLDDVPEVLALYDDVNRVIYVGESWTDQSPAHLSILVHEMVHHLQNILGIRYACPAAREALAYEAQDRWLDHFGREFVEEFGFDRFWLKVSTLCFLP